MTIRLVDRLLHHQPAPVVPSVPEPRSLIAPLDERIAQLREAFNYIHVSISVDFVPEDCEWCDGQGTTAVLVYGSEIVDEHIDNPLVLEAVCQRCALKPRGPIWVAGYQSRSDKDIVVEVVG